MSNPSKTYTPETPEINSIAKRLCEVLNSGLMYGQVDLSITVHDGKPKYTDRTVRDRIKLQ